MWLRKIAQNVSDTQYLSRQYLRQNPGFVPEFAVFQSSDFPHVFLGGEDDYAEAEVLAGQPICSAVDCRNLPEISSSSESMDTSQVQPEFNALVADVISKIQDVDCPLFVYCEAGINRSVAVLSTAISQLTNKSFEEAFQEIKQARGVSGVQDPYYVLGLKYDGTSDSDQQIVDELDQDWTHDWPDLSLKLPENAEHLPTTAQTEIPPDFPDDLLGDMDLLHQEKQWRQAVSTPGSLVTHDEYGWTGKVIELRGDPVNDGMVLVEYPLSAQEAEHLGADEGLVVQRFHRPLDLSPTMQLASPFRHASSWLQKIAQQKLLVIARGPSGSGKSRMTKEISGQYGAPVFSSDDFFMINGEYQFDRDYVGDAHFWNQGRVEEAMQGDMPVIV